MAGFVTKLLHHGLRWWRVLNLHAFKFFPKLVLPDVIKLAESIDLAQCEFGLAEIFQAWLTVVLGYLLVGCG